MSKALRLKRTETCVSESEWFTVDNYFIFSDDLKHWQHGRVFRNLAKDPKRQRKDNLKA